MSEFLFQPNHGSIDILDLGQKLLLAFGKFDELLQPRAGNLGRHAVFSRATQTMQIDDSR